LDGRTNVVTAGVDIAQRRRELPDRKLFGARLNDDDEIAPRDEYIDPFNRRRVLRAAIAPGRRPP